MNNKIFYAMALALTSQVQAQDTVLPTVEVKADTLIDATSSVLSSEGMTQNTPADGGEWLLQVPGISGVKMGAHGVDPVIRGQKHNQLNILLDGAYVHGGCPNRMDPPTSYASSESYDSVTVFKGVQTLIYGAGGTGGTVLFERVAPTFEEGEKYKGKYGGGYRSNGDQWDVFADVAAGNKSNFIRGNINIKEGDNYEDGDGNEVRSGYSEKSAMIMLGGKTDKGTEYRLDVDSVRGEDILYPGARMDAPVSDNDTYRLNIKTQQVGSFEQLNIEAYHSDVYHEMDNYSYRTNPMWMLVFSDSITDGARIVGDMAMGAGMLTLGIDTQNSDRDSIRYAGMAGMVPTASQSFLWPGVEIEQTGLFAEYTGEVSKGNRYTAGIRYDSAEASASKAALSPASGMSPDQLYTMYYGTTASDHSEDNIGALYRMEHDVSKHTMVFWGISQTKRTADATERYLSANNMMTAMRWIGNPNLDPETHRQLDIGVNREGKNGSISVSAYYDDVADYILRDRAHGQDGILQADNATIYRNVDAELYGIDAEADYRWTKQWQSRFTLAYVHASNTSDNRVIAQTPPLEGTASLEYHRDKWMLGGELRAVDKQTRVEDNMMLDSGLDAGQTPGFVVLNLYGNYKFSKQGEFKYGVDNVFDKTYAEHLNKPNAFDPTVIQINEPGRSFWARVNMKF